MKPSPSAAPPRVDRTWTHEKRRTAIGRQGHRAEIGSQTAGRTGDAVQHGQRAIAVAGGNLNAAHRAGKGRGGDGPKARRKVQKPHVQGRIHASAAAKGHRALAIRQFLRIKAPIVGLGAIGDPDRWSLRDDGRDAVLAERKPPPQFQMKMPGFADVATLSTVFLGTVGGSVSRPTSREPGRSPPPKLR